MDVETQLEMENKKQYFVEDNCRYMVMLQLNEASRSFNLNFQKVLQVK